MFPDADSGKEKERGERKSERTVKNGWPFRKRKGISGTAFRRTETESCDRKSTCFRSDEATSALDPQTTASILSLLKEINEKLGITIVIITHQMSVIREICSHVAIIEHGVLVEDGLVEDIFSHPKSKAAKELILRDQPGNNNAPLANAVQERMQGDKKIRIVFSENSAFEPVIANMILQFKTPVNILRADTKNVGGVAKGEMILGLPEDRHLQVDIEEYLKEKGLAVEEVTEDVE